MSTPFDVRPVPAPPERQGLPVWLRYGLIGGLILVTSLLLAHEIVSPDVRTVQILLAGVLLVAALKVSSFTTLLFIALAGLWGLVFTGFPYAIALKTGSPGAVGASFILFFPFAFLTTATLPQEALTGWLDTIATFNPMTYLLAALRSLLYGGWQPQVLLEGFAAIAGVGIVSLTLALTALRGRIARG